MTNKLAFKTLQFWWNGMTWTHLLIHKWRLYKLIYLLLMCSTVCQKGRKLNMRQRVGKFWKIPLVSNNNKPLLANRNSKHMHEKKTSRQTVNSQVEKKKNRGGFEKLFIGWLLRHHARKEKEREWKTYDFFFKFHDSSKSVIYTHTNGD